MSGYFILDKVAFRTKTIIRDSEGHYIMIKVNIIKSYSNPKCVFTKQQSCQKCEAKNWWN